MAQLKNVNVDNLVVGGVTLNGKDLETRIEALEETIHPIEGKNYSTWYHYKKYSDGSLEAWWNIHEIVAVPNTWGNTYISVALRDREIPNAIANMIISTPIYTGISLIGSNTDAAWIMVTGDCIDFKKYVPTYYIVRGDVLTAQKDFYVQVHILGYWK